MDAFEDGKFPFGTDCSMGSGEKAFCLDGKCIKFDENDIPVDDGINFITLSYYSIYNLMIAYNCIDKMPVINIE